MRSFARAVRLAWGVSVVIVATLSVLPASSRPVAFLEEFGLGDKLEHALAYAVLGFLPTLVESRRRLLGYLLFSGALGIALEFLQRFSPGRTFDYADMAADLMGLVVGCLIASQFRRLVPLEWRSRL
jgi:VanZ family protein